MDEFDDFPERDGELELPDDLAAMAEQLSDDAQRLAACYPPQYGPVREVAAAVASVVPRRERALRTAWFVGSVGSGLVALGFLVAFVLHGSQQPRAEIPAVAAGANDAGNQARDDAASSLAVVPDASARELTLPAVSSDASPPLTPAILQRGVTGAEMEGLMDLQRIDLAFDTESIEF
ncbi:MAG TPA: hypothetical protein VMP01_17020 [Pirellulaceae bacterium]|nr:hypothetical protein [Pirellulaceae bacterium]